MNIRQLQAEVAHRRKNQATIRQGVNEYCREQFGINNFYQLVKSHYSFISLEVLSICLARQVPCVNIEHLSIRAMTDWLKQQAFATQFVSLGLSRDSVACNNSYKLSLVKPDILQRSRNGGLTTRRSHLLKREQRNNLDAKIFDQLETECGHKLIDYHENHRLAINAGSDYTTDQSAWLKALMQATINGSGSIKPNSLYVRRGEFEKRVDFAEADFNNGHDPRPPADWYYLPYLLLFVDGTMALASTVDEDPKVVQWIGGNLAKIESICGVKPLLINTPLRTEYDGYVSYLNETPAWVLDNPNWQGRLDFEAHQHQTIFEITSNIQKSIISLA